LTSFAWPPTAAKTHFHSAVENNSALAPATASVSDHHHCVRLNQRGYWTEFLQLHDISEHDA
jgi:hypothetical protein